MTLFERAFNRVIAAEGGYSNITADRGGKTMLGITERTARLHGYTGDMEKLTIDDARRIYKSAYWDACGLDAIGALSPAIALELFDTGVNCGVGVARAFLQRCLNALNRQGKDYADIPPGAAIGVTVGALTAFLQRRGHAGEATLLAALNALQGARYIEIAERDPTQETFLNGWLKNRVAA